MRTTGGRCRCHSFRTSNPPPCTGGSWCRGARRGARRADPRYGGRRRGGRAADGRRAVAAGRTALLVGVRGAATLPALVFELRALSVAAGPPADRERVPVPVAPIVAVVVAPAHDPHDAIGLTRAPRAARSARRRRRRCRRGLGGRCRRGRGGPAEPEALTAGLPGSGEALATPRAPAQTPHELMRALPAPARPLVATAVHAFPRDRAASGEAGTLALARVEKAVGALVALLAGGDDAGSAAGTLLLERVDERRRALPVASAAARRRVSLPRHRREQRRDRHQYGREHPHIGAGIPGTPVHPGYSSTNVRQPLGLPSAHRTFAPASRCSLALYYGSARSHRGSPTRARAGPLSSLPTASSGMATRMRTPAFGGERMSSSPW